MCNYDEIIIVYRSKIDISRFIRFYVFYYFSIFIGRPGKNELNRIEMFEAYIGLSCSY